MADDSNINFSPITIDPILITDAYLDKNSWRVKENSTSQYSIGGLILHQSGTITANYWLNKVYSSEVANAHRNCDFHIHDLNFLAAYCAGWNIAEILEEGVGGVRGKIESGPPKHLNTAVQQLVNFLGILQNCWAAKTPILFADGTIKTFKECEDEHITNGDVIVYDTINNQFCIDNAYNIGKKSENSPMIELELENGEFFRCEPWHMLFTSNRGYVEAQDLTEDDDIKDFLSPTNSF
jgi:anaerobic ribonucleoside-triphosphate reductase